MNPQNRSGGPGHPPGTAAEKIAAAAKQPDQDQTTAAVRVPARFYGPSARRTLGVLLVTSCPFCPSGGPHMHRGSGGLRRSGCGRGEYVVVAAPALQKPKRGAA